MSFVLWNCRSSNGTFILIHRIRVQIQIGSLYLCSLFLMLVQGVINLSTHSLIRGNIKLEKHCSFQFDNDFLF